MDVRYYDYIKALKSGSITTAARLEFLDSNGLVDFDVTDDMISDGQLSVNFQDGIRRTATITLSNLNQDYNVQLNKIWVGQTVKLYAGIILPDGEEYLLPQGVFYITNPEETLQPTNNTITLNLIDKWSGLDGTIGGTLDGTYLINTGDDLLVAAEQLLQIDRGNGQPLDPIPPVFDRTLLDMTATVYDADGNAKTIPFTEAPYTLKTEASSTYADVLLGINTMLITSIGYDVAGQLRIMNANTDVADSTRPISWDFSLDESEFYGATFTYNINELCNDVKIIGAVSNGMQVQGRATNKNPRSSCNVMTIGYNTFTETQSKYYSFQQCNDLAKYYLRKKTMLQKQVSFTTTPIYHLQENSLVTLLRPEVSDTPEVYLVTGFNMPIGGTNSMSITAVSVDEIDIFDKWLPTYSLSVLCSEISEIVIEYNNLTTGLSDNPYDVYDIPAGTTITFSVKAPSGTLDDDIYKISSVRLNGAYISHSASSCSFRMPDYDSKIVINLTSVSGGNVSYTYTGNKEESQETLNGTTYKVIKLISDGTLTFDSEQVENGIVGDVWVRAGGGGGSTNAKGGNGYSTSEYSHSFSESYTVAIGAGGSNGTKRGSKGGNSSFGDISAVGGMGANGDSDATSTALSNVFGEIVDTAGAGGDAGSSGTAGAVWIRIVM